MNPGDLIATLDLDDPEAVTRAEPYAGGFPDLGPPQVYSSGVEFRFKQSLRDAKMILAGKSKLTALHFGVAGGAGCWSVWLFVCAPVQRLVA